MFNFSSDSDCIKRSFKKEIVGRFFFSVEKRSWYKVVESTHLFTSFSYAFGARWTDYHYHAVKLVVKCTRKEIRLIEKATKSEFFDLSV